MLPVFGKARRHPGRSHHLNFSHHRITLFIHHHLFLLRIITIIPA
jgi:hypothetical protein